VRVVSGESSGNSGNAHFTCGFCESRKKPATLVQNENDSHENKIANSVMIVSSKNASSGDGNVRASDQLAIEVCAATKSIKTIRRRTAGRMPRSLRSRQRLPDGVLYTKDPTQCGSNRISFQRPRRDRNAADSAAPASALVVYSAVPSEICD
jgi:hypothetical protein